jgi:hypothetical protein
MQTATPRSTISKTQIEEIYDHFKKSVKKHVFCSVFVNRTFQCSPHLEIIHKVETPDLRIGTLLVPAPVEDGTRGAGGVHPPGVPHQQDNLHTIKDISTS